MELKAGVDNYVNLTSSSKIEANTEEENATNVAENSPTVKMNKILFLIIALFNMTNIKAQSNELPGNNSLPSTEDELKKHAEALDIHALSHVIKQKVAAVNRAEFNNLIYSYATMSHRNELHTDYISRFQHNPATVETTNLTHFDYNLISLDRAEFIEITKPNLPFHRPFLCPICMKVEQNKIVYTLNFSTLTDMSHTIEKLNSMVFTAGDSIYFKSGDYWEGMFWLRGSGSPTQPIIVDVYGSTMKLRDVSAITTPDQRTIQIQPWDKSTAAPIEKALIDAKLGITPIVTGELIRMPIPELSGERREELCKMAQGFAEQGRIGIRASRKDAMDALKEAQKEGLPEDDYKRFEKEVQKCTDDSVSKINEALSGKESDLRAV